MGSHHTCPSEKKIARVTLAFAVQQKILQRFRFDFGEHRYLSLALCASDWLIGYATKRIQ
jgi:hypothetical protein